MLDLDDSRERDAAKKVKIVKKLRNEKLPDFSVSACRNLKTIEKIKTPCFWTFQVIPIVREYF